MVHRCHIYMYIRWPIWPPTPLLDWVTRSGDKPQENCSLFFSESFTRWCLDTNSFVCLIIGKPNTNSLPRPSSRWDFEKKSFQIFLFLFSSDLFMAFLTWQPLKGHKQVCSLPKFWRLCNDGWVWLLFLKKSEKFPKGENMPSEIRKLVNVFLWRFFKLRQVCINLS